MRDSLRSPILSDSNVSVPAFVADSGSPSWSKNRYTSSCSATDLSAAPRAIVSVRGWHTDVFTPAMMKHSPEIFRFVEENVRKEATRLFPENPGDDTAGLTRILVLPALPTAEPFRSQSVELLKARGVDAIISFRAMLLDLLDKVEVNQSYSKSSVLQVMRILKNYDLLKDMQLEMFSDRPAPTRKPRA